MFQSPKKTSGVVPGLLNRAWTKDNDRATILWEMAQSGSVSGDTFCVPSDSEAMTPEGWMSLRELQARPDLPIGTLNPYTSELEWQPAALNVFWYEGDLVHHKSTCMDHLATPDHDMWVRLSNSATWKKRHAVDVTNNGWRVRTAVSSWQGAYTPVTVPGSTESKASASRCPDYTFPDAMDLAEFVGWYVSEGSTGSHNRVVQIAQSRNVNPEKFAQITALVKRMGFQPGTSSGVKVDVMYAPLARWARETFGINSKEKHLPAWVKNWPAPMLERMLEAMLLGDGTRLDPRRTSQRYRVYRTTSDRLVDDLQEVAVKLGWSSSAKDRVSSPYVNPNGATYEGSSRAVHFVQYADRGTVKPAIVPYVGEVWCPTVPNGLWFHRRGGQVVVTGNCKVAYEEPSMYPPEPVPGVQQRFIPGRVRILPLNSSFCFPVWHPHDRNRLLQFKQKYRFWFTAADGTRQIAQYCVDDQTEALTRRGWITHDQMTTADEVYAIDPKTREAGWQPVLAVNRFDHDGPLTRFKGKRLDALTTPNHRWMRMGRNDDTVAWTTTEQVAGQAVRVLHGGGTPVSFSDVEKISTPMAELVAWTVTEGAFKQRCSSVVIGQSELLNPTYAARIRRIAQHFTEQGASVGEYPCTQLPGFVRWNFGKGVGADIRALTGPDKQLTPEFLSMLTLPQAEMVFETLIDADGHRRKGSSGNTVTFTQKDKGRVDGFQMLCSMLGKRSHSRYNTHNGCYSTTVYKADATWMHTVDTSEEHYKGIVWCPSVPTKTWLARRNGVTYWTGNTEIITDLEISEYINDRLLEGSPRPNPLGMIPVVHIPNTAVGGSPWGASDIDDIVDLNRVYNEVATEISDIINYYSAPVTILTGARRESLERGARKLWSITDAAAKVYNLSGGQEGLEGAFKLLEWIKQAMHELTGVPQGSLGQFQPVSNTSGVALAINYQPLMLRRRKKIITYDLGLRRINELVLRTLAQKEPEVFTWSPDYDEELEDYQDAVLDLDDPVTYESSVHWPPPLPVDKMAKLAELQQTMGLGLESKKGALAALGEEFPEIRMDDIYRELIDDKIDQGALDMLQAAITRAVADATGIMPQPDGGMEDVTSAGGPDVNTASDAGMGNTASSGAGTVPMGGGAPMGMDEVTYRKIVAQLNQKAYGTTRATSVNKIPNT